MEAGHACAFADQLWSRPAVFVIFIPLIIHTADTHIQGSGPTITGAGRHTPKCSHLSVDCVKNPESFFEDQIVINI